MRIHRYKQIDLIFIKKVALAYTLSYGLDEYNILS